MGVNLIGISNKVIKSYEYALAGVNSAYDFSAIHAERESLREQIRELEQLVVSEEPLVPDDEIPPEIDNPGYGDDGDIAATPV